jgi:hypothetical protein
MIRKTLFAIAAVATVSAAAFVPTAASAKGGFYHHGFGLGGFGLRVITSDYSCVRWVRVGYKTYRKTNICY